MKYFTIEELEYSSTAKERGIDNRIPEELIPGVEEFIEKILDPLREEWGSPIRVNSCYRSPALNKAVGGSKSSAHCLGLAADLSPINREMEEFKNCILSFLKEKEFD